MIRLLPAFCAALIASASLAQETPAAPPADDLRLLRQLIEQQSKQLEMLTQQVAKLTQLVEKNQTASLPAPAATQDMPPAQTVVPSVTTAAAESAKTEAVTTPDGSVQHVVSKGETLSSISKHYQVSIGDLLKVNKITDERKLQIGQTLTIPPKPADAQKQNKL